MGERNKKKIIFKQHKGCTREQFIIKINLHKIWKEISFNSDLNVHNVFCRNLRGDLAFSTFPYPLSIVKMNTSKTVRHSDTTRIMKCKSIKKVFFTGQKIRNTNHYNAQILSNVIFSQPRIISAEMVCEKYM